ncbi:MAG: hypothetical protein ACKVOG_06360 [Rhodoglobus sp.]
MRQLVKIALSGSLLVAGVVISGWIAVLTYVLDRIGIWTPALWADTVSIALLTALSAILSQRVLKGQGTLRQLASELLTPVLVLELLTSLGTFDLWIELLIPPVLLVFGLVGLLAYPAAKTTSGVLLGASGLAILTLSIVLFIQEASASDYAQAVRQLAYTVIVLAALFPFALIFGSINVYADAFRSSAFGSDKAGVPSLRGKLAIVYVFRSDTALLGRLAPMFAIKVGRQPTIDAAVAEARRGRLAFLENEAEAVTAANRLVEFAGVKGMDTEGKQLDQREFRETQEALLHLQTFMIVRHREVGRFESSVLSNAVATYWFQKLPNPLDIDLRIQTDGQAWYAWRKTVGGWVFAIGQSNPKDDWRFDGPEPPTTYPGIGERWGEAGGSNTANW